jgi:hypothetical protein
MSGGLPAKPVLMNYIMASNNTTYIYHFLQLTVKIRKHMIINCAKLP